MDEKVHEFISLTVAIPFPSDDGPARIVFIVDFGQK